MKDAIARAGERLGRLKLNGRLRTRSPLSDVVELETLVVGIAGKEALWSSLRSATSLPSDELDHLIDRAEGQKRIVERAREAAVRRVFEQHNRSLTAPRSRRTLLQKRGALPLLSALTLTALLALAAQLALLLVVHSAPLVRQEPGVPGVVRTRTVCVYGRERA